MRLPADDSIVLPEGDDGPMVCDESDPPALALDDVLALLPAWARRASSAIRDGFLQALRTLAMTMWARSSFVLAAMQSPRFADGEWLDAWGVIKKLPRTTGELDPSYRARLLAYVDVVSPQAVKAAVNELVYDLTGRFPFYIEPRADFSFAGSKDTASPGPRCFAQSRTATRRYWASGPRSSARPIGAYALSRRRLPAFWIGLGLAADDPALCALVISTVDALRGGGVPWRLFIDPALEASTHFEAIS